METHMESQGRLSVKSVISIQYFIYFCILGVYLPYFNLYCYHLGFSGFEIGILSSVRSVTLVIFALAWGSLADRRRMRRPIYIGCAAVSAALWALFLFNRQFVPMLVVTFFYGMFFSPLISFLEAVTINLLGRESRQYGRIRAWGSLSFVTTVIVVGKLIGGMPADIVIVLILGGSIALSLSAFGIPETTNREKVPLFSSHARFLLSRRALVFFASSLLMLVSHGAYYGFFSIHLENLGYGSTFIGFAWALASIAEILVMIKSEDIFKRFTLENVLMFSFLAAILRWILLSFADSVTVILLAQLLHAMTYGTFHMASILYMDRLSPERSKTLGQAVNNALTYGVGLMIGFYFSGVLYESRGGFVLFLISSGVAAGAYFIFRVFGGRGEGRDIDGQ